MTTDVMEEKNIYLSNFEQFEKSVDLRAPIHEVRKAAIDRFAELGLPTTWDEEWRFTNVAPLAKIPFRLASAEERDAFDSAKLEALVPAVQGHRLVFVNGHYAPELSSHEAMPAGVVVHSLAAVLQAHPDWVEPHLARHAKFQEHAFTALNTAFMRDGVFVSVPKGKVIAEPIELLFVSTTPGEGTVSHPRNLVVVGPGAQLTLIETFVGLDENVYFTNAVTEIVAGEGAVIDHYKIQRESVEAFHVATTQIYQTRDSNFSSHFISLGGSLVRNEINVVLDGENCECTLNGLYLANGTQHVDCHTVIDHAKPHCNSHELYKAVLDGKGHGVFNGKIFVRQDAQKTDAKQTNQTLLLSNDATINTKPQLEIFADDVKCTHGATVGQLQEEQLFYLRTRGIGLQEARSLLTFAFANDIVGRIKVEPIRAQLEEMLVRARR